MSTISLDREYLDSFCKHLADSIGLEEDVEWEIITTDHTLISRQLILRLTLWDGNKPGGEEDEGEGK